MRRPSRQAGSSPRATMRYTWAFDTPSASAVSLAVSPNRISAITFVILRRATSFYNSARLDSPHFDPSGIVRRLKDLVGRRRIPKLYQPEP